MPHPPIERLPDPRAFGAGEHTLLAPVAAVLAAAAPERRARHVQLSAELSARVEKGEEEDIRRAFAAMPDASHFHTLFEALAQGVESPAADPQAVRLRLFAIPLVLVAAAVRPLTIAGTLANRDAVQRLFERSGVLGPMRNFGLSGALCAREALAALSPRTILEAGTRLDAEPIESRLPGADIAVAAGREQAHLRFLLGAGIGRADAPDIAETAAHMGAWANDLSRLLGAQLAADGLQLLVLPRVPQGLMRAPYAGRRAQLEVALHLFVSNTVRRFRSMAGDPVAILSAHDDSDLRLTLSSPFAEELVEGFRWPLAPLDDLERIACEIAELLAAVRIDDVRVLPSTLPARRGAGGIWFPRTAEWEALACAGARH